MKDGSLSVNGDIARELVEERGRVEEHRHHTNAPHYHSKTQQRFFPKCCIGNPT
jgi:hypothetical protein